MESENQTADRIIKVDYFMSQVKMDALFRAARIRSDQEISEEFVKRWLENAYLEYLLYSPRENSGMDSTIIPRRGSTHLIPIGSNKKKLSTISVKAEKATKHGQATIAGKLTAKLRKTVNNAFDQLLMKLTFPLPGARDDKRDQELMRILSWTFDGDVDRLEVLLERISGSSNFVV